MHDRDDLRHPGRAHQAADPRPPARAAPPGGRAGRVQAPAGAARRAAGRRAPRRAAPDLRRASGAAGGDRRVARALPAPVRRPPRRPGTPPRPDEGAAPMNAAANDGTLEKLDDGRSRIRFERRLAHPVDRVWTALTDPDEMRKWWAAADELELREGGRFTIRLLNTDEEGNSAVARG